MPLTINAMMRPMLRNKFCIDVIDPLNPGTRSRVKPVRAALSTPRIGAQAPQKATEIQMLGTTENTTAKKPEMNAPTTVRGFLPNRLTIFPPAAAPNAPAAIAIEEKRGGCA